jgi:ribosomal protein S20
VTASHRELVSWLDKAASRGSLHKNTAARRKAQAARIASGQQPEAATSTKTTK